MSVLQSGFSKRGPSSLSLNIAPRFPSFQINCTSSNKENYPEASTPQLPKKTPFNSKTSLSVKKSNFSAQQCAQEPESPIEISFDKESPAEFHHSIPKEPKSAMFRKKEAEMSFCGDKTPLVLDVGCASPLCNPERDYNEELYKRAEEYLDSLHFVIVLPEDHRRRPFGNLRVSTAKVPSSEGAASEHNSPSLISPSIHTSSLFQRRSSSKKDSNCTPAKQKLALAKSPFYNCLEKGKRLFATEANSNKDGNTDIDEDSAFEKSSPLLVVTSLNAKFTGMSLRASRELSDSSATSFKLEEDSPLKIIV